MKTGFKRTLAGLAMLFGFALLLASVNAQPSFTHSNQLIPNFVTAFPIATGGGFNSLAALAAATNCPERAAVYGDAESKDGTEKEREDANADKDCEGKTTGDDHVEDGRGDHCDGTSDDLEESNDQKSALIKSRCTSTDVDGKQEPATAVLTFMNNAPLPTTFTVSWVTASGKVYGAQGIMLPGSYTLIQ
jgi:hypothetical protein